MMCNCKETIEEQVEEQFIKQTPEAKNITVELDGYAFRLGGIVTLHPCMDAEITADLPLKKGGFKWKKQTTRILFSHCPFCGEKLEGGE